MVRYNGWISIPEPYANGLFAQAGFDSVTLDCQHGGFDERALALSLQALKTPQRLVRVLWNEPALIGKALDLGADGVIVPLVNSAAEARRMADACRYPPKGSRSFGPGPAALRAPDAPYASLADSIEAWAMIETREALDSVDAIAATPGVDGLFVGPNDLALSLGLGAGSNRQEPEILAALARIDRAAKAAGKMSGVFCTTAAYARQMATLGFDMVTTASDTLVFADAARRILAEAKA
ncbi:MAG: 2,4-dihydroxyhept-2-ene-1,7-dioic acid aldolase [Alphaproteobacteria bacterium]|nr:2,4-dihydroxyhept-2-ene-1,7-dioic acid aldolase [Alphaproteobacteria bacterium]